MRHCIIVKWNGNVTKESVRAMYPDILSLFLKTKEIDGIRDVRLIENCIARDNRYDLMIELDMDESALPAYDSCEWHIRWKEQYGSLIEKKIIIDLSDNPFEDAAKENSDGSSSVSPASDDDLHRTTDAGNNAIRYTASANRYDCSMTYHRCGKSGLKLPRVSLGLWHSFGDTCDIRNMKDLLFTAFDNGITHFDLANNYGPPYGSAESNLGKILNDDLKSYRDELIISTKAGYDMWPGPYGDHGSRKYLLASLDQSLKRMKLDYVDIFYHHRPDPDTPLEETMGALAEAVHSGKALYVGLSRYDGKTMREAAAILSRLNCPFVINQVRYSLFDRTVEHNGLKQAAFEDGKGIITFSPLEQGVLSDKYIKGIPEDSRIRKDGRYLQADVLTPQRIEQLKKLNSIAVERGETLAQMALNWVLRDDVVTSVLIGASKSSQIKENCMVTSSKQFTSDELERIEQIWNEYPVPCCK